MAYRRHPYKHESTTNSSWTAERRHQRYEITDCRMVDTSNYISHTQTFNKKAKNEFAWQKLRPFSRKVKTVVSKSGGAGWRTSRIWTKLSVICAQKNNNFELHVSCGLHDICSLSININVYTREDNEMSNVRWRCLLPCDKTFLKKEKKTVEIGSKGS